ncbi:MAG: GTP cyclohydrolase II [Alphaproteobacteria bacterium]|jgi:GTP cyclohydrolase II|nr:GTP cyclohydrolase II [Alphaproteobacteria bacterium]MDP6567441.1 GTP cyclohydrolase II [Alphaproteobacteria bacterium]MDP6813572.1 GTP cyclohydrolase II [Alphaproteobacteria bacterium]
MTEAGDSQLSVDRAIADFRRGVPVVLRQAEDTWAVALAAEQATADSLDRLRQWGGATTVLALTDSRGRALHIKPTGHPVILLPLADNMDISIVQTLADATTDLAQPMRGPFQRARRAPSDAELAAIELAKAARLLPSAVLATPDGEAAAFAARQGLLVAAVAAVAAFEDRAAQSLRPVADAPVPLAEAENSRIVAFRPADGGIEHLAIIVGDPDRHHPVLTRLHSECFTGDLLGSLKCDCGQQLRAAVAVMAGEGAGVLLYLAQEGRGIGLMNKLRAYRLQADGFDTVDANLRLGFDADERVFRPAAEMLRHLGFAQVRLLTNNPDKVAGLRACGIEVTERVAHSFPANAHNEFYLQTKKDRSGHLL